MLTAATANVSPLSWWQALAAAGGLALASLVAGVIVILGRRTFVGSARLSAKSAARPQRGPVGRRTAGQAAQPDAHPDAPATVQGGQPSADQPPAAISDTQAAQPPATPADQSAPQSDGDFIRSWIAITLVIALIFFCAFAFSLNDSSLQSTLIGGLIASVGTAVAFYFSSKASDKARQDIINAAGVGNELVPSLTGKTKADAAQMLGQTSFSLIEDPNAPSKSSTAVIKTQYPLANTSAPRGSSIVVTFG